METGRVSERRVSSNKLRRMAAERDSITSRTLGITARPTRPRMMPVRLMKSR